MSLTVKTKTQEHAIPHLSGANVTNVLASVHRQTASATAKAVTLGPKLPAIALPAVDISLMYGHVSCLQHLVAQS